MKLYLISQFENNGYDTYDSAVVAAVDAQTAADTHPDGSTLWDSSKRSWFYVSYAGERVYPSYSDGSWVDNPDKVSVLEIGEAHSDIGPGVVCASFNAG